MLENFFLLRGQNPKHQKDGANAIGLRVSRVDKPFRGILWQRPQSRHIVPPLVLNRERSHISVSLSLLTFPDMSAEVGVREPFNFFLRCPCVYSQVCFYLSLFFFKLIVIYLWWHGHFSGSFLSWLPCHRR